MTHVAVNLEDIPVEGALTVLLPDGCQVAVFRMHDDQVLAVGNRDPFSGANVIAKGIVGSHGSTPTVTSPMHHHIFDLATGLCLSDDGPALDTYHAVVSRGIVSVGPTSM